MVYDSTNFVTTGDASYGYLGITTIDKSAIFGDSLHLTATGKLTSFTWAAFNGAGSPDTLASASQTISFYRQSDASLIGSFNATITNLGKGAYKTFTADLTSANIELDTPDILVTQQIPFWPPASPNYRVGMVIATASNTPAVGTTSPGYYSAVFGNPGSFSTNVSYPNYSSAVYKAVVLPDVAWNTSSGTWNTTDANWTLGPDGGSTVFSDGDQATFDSTQGGAVILSGALAPRAVVVSAASGVYFFWSTDGNQITGNATLAKRGGGRLILNGPNTYSGATTVSGGTLQVDGSLPNSPVTVGSGGTLGGTGSIGGLLTVQSGGTLSPGTSPGVLTAASLELQAGSTTVMELVGSGSSAGTAGSGYDQLVVTTFGGLTYGGSLVLSIDGTPTFSNGTEFSLFSFTGAAGGAFASVSTAAGSSAYSGMTFSFAPDGRWYTPDTSAGQYLIFTPSTGTVAVVPEPSTWGMGLVGAGVAAWVARRRREIR